MPSLHPKIKRSFQIGDELYEVLIAGVGYRVTRGSDTVLSIQGTTVALFGWLWVADLSYNDSSTPTFTIYSAKGPARMTVLKTPGLYGAINHHHRIHLLLKHMVGMFLHGQYPKRWEPVQARIDEALLQEQSNNTPGRIQRLTY
jgi:hypothetical protein